MPELTISVVSSVDILPVYHAIPEFARSINSEEIDQRLGHRESIALIAYVDGNPAGFKLGYQINDRLFYSWLGGVLPDYRRYGVAQSLLVAQENMCRTKGYCWLQVKTRNCFPGMMRLLIKNKFQIISLEKKGSPSDYRLLFEKQL